MTPEARLRAHDWRYAEQKAAELVALMYSPKLKEPLKTKLGEAALKVIQSVIDDTRRT